jgi:methionyl-tRNA formyltransferase
MKPISLGYFADGPWGHRALDKLVQDPSIHVAFICARFEHPDPVLKEQAGNHRIPWFTHPSVNASDFLQSIAGYECDLFVSMSFNQIFRKQLIEYPRLGTINCHAGRLPFYRGRNILNWALINDEKEFGITVHYVDAGIDTGDILAQRLFPITDQDNYATLLECAYAGCAELLYDTIKNLQIGKTTRLAQTEIHPLGFYCSNRIAGDERLNWQQNSRDIFNFVRALCRPGPEARTFRGDAELKINRVDLLPQAPVYKGVPGAVLGVNGEGFVVKTADSYVRVSQWSGAESIRTGDRLK